jgi:predicted nucleotidyltransferase
MLIQRATTCELNCGVILKVGMRIDPKGRIANYPALMVRRALRCLRGDIVWGEEALENAAKLTPGTGRAFAQALKADGLIEASRHGGWTVTQAGNALAAATAARPVSRSTAERALAEFLERVARVNDDPYFLARVNRVALYGSLLRPEVARLSDVDLAVQLVGKETDPQRLREANAKRVEQLAMKGTFFGNFLEEQFCWFLETFRFLKARSRVISLADYNVEKRMVLAVPHRMLLGEGEEVPPEPASEAPRPAARTRRPRDCPF